MSAMDSGDGNGAMAPASERELGLIDAWWRAANYVSVGQIYLCDNPLLAEPLSAAHIKRMLLGHWGTTPGQNFIYAHLNHIIRAYGVNMIYISGPGHGGPALVGNAYLEGTNGDRKSTRLNSSHGYISYAVFCLKKKKTPYKSTKAHRRHPI